MLAQIFLVSIGAENFQKDICRDEGGAETFRLFHEKTKIE
jgi:hypothetical protein